MSDDTYFAGAVRNNKEEINEQRRIIDNLPLVLKVLDSIPTTLILLNQNRQAVYCNKSFIEMLGLTDDDQIIGLRPGEVLNCVNALSAPSGCGTGLFCRFCPAVNAILESIKGESITTECKINILKNNEHDFVELRITAIPLYFDDTQFVCFSISNITDIKRFNLLEHIFIHDISNTVTVIQCISDLMKLTDNTIEINELMDNLTNVTNQLSEEIQSHRDLLMAEQNELKVKISDIDSTLDFLQEFKYRFRIHPIAYGKHIEIDDQSVLTSITTDVTLLRRVFANMLKNALEASDEGDKILIGCRIASDDKVCFYVHNVQVMNDEVKANLFKRSFSTKGLNRGLGTYSIRLLTEKFLKGKINYISEEHKGTTFSICLPYHISDNL